MGYKNARWQQKAINIVKTHSSPHVNNILALFVLFISVLNSAHFIERVGVYAVNSLRCIDLTAGQHSAVINLHN